MRSRLAGVTLVVTLVVVCATLLAYRSGSGGNVSTYHECAILSEPYHPVPVYLRSVDTSGADSHVIKLQNSLRDQRNQLAKELNALRKKMGQQDCEKEAKKDTNTVGGWCKQSSKEDGGQHMTDMKLKVALSEFFKGKTVGSFGDGPGAYKREILKDGTVKSYDAYDGAPYCEETSEGRVTFMDLTIPQFNIPMYDWILSLEVAEHIPKEYESIYMDNLARHAREGIIMSWAVPEQGGLAHINNRPFNYVVKLLEHYGFRHDKEASETLQKRASFQWLVLNTNVYRRFNTTDMEALEKWYT